jgi:nucleoid-associated protein YgaU
VWLCGTAALLGPAWLVGRVARRAWTRPSGVATLPFDQALTELAAAVLLGCALWAWLAITATVVEATRGTGAPGRPPRPCRLPGPLRRAVLGACGVALASGLAQPALAASTARQASAAASSLSRVQRATHEGGGTSVATRLAGLPLPALPAVRHAGPPRRVVAVVTVVSGDSLWSIAERDLPYGATAQAVSVRWHQIYAENRDVIGADPGLLAPGQRLILPARDLSPTWRKDPT